MTWRLIGAVLLCCLLGACTSGAPKTPQITVWTALEDKELKVFRDIMEEFSVDSGHQVVVLKVPFKKLRDKFLVAAPAGQGPDLIVGPQDWLGIFAVAGLLEPVQLSREVLPVASEAVTFEGKTYALPLMLECLALVRNTKLAPDEPTSLEEMLAHAKSVTKGEVRGFYYELEEFYFSWPFFAAHGAYLFGTRSDGIVDPLDIGLANEGAILAADWVGRLRRDGLIPLGATNDLAKGLFMEGKLAYFLTGPWSMSEIRKSDIPYAVHPIPPLRGQAAAPFVGATGIMQNRLSRQPEEARRLLDFMGQEKILVRMALASGRTPAHAGAVAKVENDPVLGSDLSAFTQIAREGTPMPNHPALTAVWEPMEQAIELVASGQIEATEQMPATVRSIQSKIRFMME